MNLAHWVANATTLLTIAGLAYCLLALWAARAYSRSRRVPQPAAYPSVSILKPIKGVDPGMYKDFVSHCNQEYPGEYEILFGVRQMDDEAVPLIQRLKVEFPEPRDSSGTVPGDARPQWKSEHVGADVAAGSL